MNKIEFLMNLDLYKYKKPKNVIQHDSYEISKSEMHKIQSDYSKAPKAYKDRITLYEAYNEEALAHAGHGNTKYYQKIDNFYGPGSHRYFYSKEEWDAYNNVKDKEPDYMVDRNTNKMVKNNPDGTTFKTPTTWDQFRNGSIMEDDQKIERTLKESGMSAGIKAIMRDERMQEFLTQFEGGFENYGWDFDENGKITGLNDSDKKYVKDIENWARKFTDKNGNSLFESKEFQDKVTEEIRKRYDTIKEQKEQESKARKKNKKVSHSAYYEDDDELTHYGTRGQKWGVRKWQNYDGTFNEAGKQRYFGSGKKETNTGIRKGLFKIAAKMADRMQERQMNKWNNDEEYRDRKMKNTINSMKMHRKYYDMEDLDDDEIEKLAKAMVKKGVADMYEVKKEVNRYKSDKDHYFDDVDIDDMRIYDYPKASEIDYDTAFGSYGPKKSDNAENKYQNEDGTLTQKGYKKFVMGFLEDMDVTSEDYSPSKPGKEKFNNEKFWEGEINRRTDLVNGILNDDSIDAQKAIKSDIKNKNTRKNLEELVQYCKENGITEVTNEMIEGVKAGQNYLGAQRWVDNAKSQLDVFGYDANTLRSYYTWENIKNDVVRKDKNISKFKENNSNYKEYSKLSKEANEKYNDTAQEKFIELLEKELGRKVPTKIYNPKNGTRALDMEKAYEDPEIMAIFNANFREAANYANNDKTVISMNTKAYKTLQKAESDAVKYLDKYLCSNAKKTVPGTTSYDMTTGEISETSLPAAMAYALYSDDFQKYEH